MNRTIAGLNIEHFEKLLAKETDETKRQTILSLLTEEKAKTGGARGKPEAQKRYRLGRLIPSTPVRRTDVDPFLGFGIDPSTAAWKDERM